VSRNREELAACLSRHGILYASAGQPIRHQDGTPAPWAFYSWNATLTAPGLRLAAVCILERLRGFRASQLASIGYTGIPLLSACVLLGEGRYTGLCIRESRKKYVSCRQVEGPFDKSAPVVIIDDSVSSGNSIAEAIRAVENEGGEVEGAIALVQFPYRGGLDWANSAGYRAEAILDVWSDLGMARTLAKPERRPAPLTDKVRAPEGLHPAVLARFSAATWLATGLAPRPPLQMDRNYACPGGVFVSFRERANDNRIARSGYWHFNPDDAAPCADVIAATIETLQDANGRITRQTLPELKIAVTFFSALELIKPKELDFERYGIVVRSRAFPSKMGGALPNTQAFISEVEQYRQARVTNAGIVPSEPHDLFRHEVFKYVEPGQTWLPYGSPESAAAWWRTAECGRRITSRARQLFNELQGKGEQSKAKESASAPASVDAFPLPSAPEDIGPIEAVAVRVYHPDYGLIGYGLALGTDFDAALRAAVLQAAADPRGGSGLTRGKIVVSVLHDPELLGGAAVQTVAFKLRRGLDALAIHYSGRTTILLPTVLVYNNLTRAEFVRTCERLAGAEAAAEDRQVEWRTLQCTEWVDDGRYTHPLRFGFAVRDADTLDSASLIRLLGAYVVGSLGADGLPRYLLQPASGEVQIYGTAGRAIHALMSLDLAGLFLGERSWWEAAGAGLGYCLDHVRDGTIVLPGGVGGTLADAVLLGAVARYKALRQRIASRALAARLRGLLRPEGRIGYTPKRLEVPEDHEFLPGALLAGLADFGAIQDAGAHVAWYAHHFSALPGWGQAGWLPQGMAALYRVTADRGAVELAFAATDWAIDRQLGSSGAFLEDLSPDEPSFNTGFIAEGVAASWEIAIAVGNVERAARYAAAWSAAMRFMTNLIVFPEDVFALRAGPKAIGGVRCTLTRSDIRIDQVSHCLHALVTGARLQPSGSRLNMYL
jgi:orotate phosphoribosyltransferase/AMMECR1 domain-containing protein